MPALSARGPRGQQCTHKHIVEVIDFGDDRGRLFMVMEFLEGESLSAKLKREAPLAPAEVIALLDPVMGALAAAHDQGIVHRGAQPPEHLPRDDAERRRAGAEAHRSASPGASSPTTSSSRRRA
ncbi:MAG: hypothetical protein U0325_31825 [Polyangiales bacterium]